DAAAVPDPVVVVAVLEGWSFGDVPAAAATLAQDFGPFSFSSRAPTASTTSPPVLTFDDAVGFVAVDDASVATVGLASSCTWVVGNASEGTLPAGASTSGVCCCCCFETTSSTLGAVLPVSAIPCCFSSAAATSGSGCCAESGL